MILELNSPQGGYLACQTIAQVQIRNRSVGRSVLEGLVRELLEYHVHRGLAPYAAEGVGLEESLRRAGPQIQESLGRDLESRGVPLMSLELRPVLAQAEPRHWANKGHMWVEFISPEVPTTDGFQVVLDTAALVTTFHNGEELDCRRASALTRGILEESISLSCQDLGLEDFLWRRAEWTDRILERSGDALEEAGFELRCLAITDVQVRARQEAFRPSPGRRAFDPLLNWHFMPYGDVVKAPQPEDVDQQP